MISNMKLGFSANAFSKYSLLHSIEKISIGVLPLLIPYILMVLILVYFSDWITYLPDLVYGVSK